MPLDMNCSTCKHALPWADPYGDHMYRCTLREVGALLLCGDDVFLARNPPHWRVSAIYHQNCPHHTQGGCGTIATGPQLYPEVASERESDG